MTAGQMFCWQCGVAVLSSDAFCVSCGCRLESTTLGAPLAGRLTESDSRDGGLPSPSSVNPGPYVPMTEELGREDTGHFMPDTLADAAVVIAEIGKDFKEPAASPLSNAGTNLPSRSPTSRHIIALLSVVGVIVAGGLVWSFYGRPAQQASRSKSVAVSSTTETTPHNAGGLPRLGSNAPGSAGGKTGRGMPSTSSAGPSVGTEASPTSIAPTISPSTTSFLPGTTVSLAPTTTTRVGGATTTTGAPLGDWSSPAPISHVGTMESISCASSSFCLAADYEETYSDTYTYNGIGWSSATEIDPVGYGVYSISCPSSTFCVAVGGGGLAYTYSNGRWATPLSVDPGYNLSSVSCSSPAFCVAVDLGGDVVNYRAGSWSQPANIDSSGGGTSASVSCVSDAFCVMVDHNGRAFMYDGSSWSGPMTIDPNDGGFGRIVYHAKLLRRGRSQRERYYISRRSLVQPYEY